MKGVGAECLRPDALNGVNHIIISKYLYSAKFTNKCALMRRLIKYIVIDCVQHIYIYIYIYKHTYIHMYTYTQYIQ